MQATCVVNLLPAGWGNCYTWYIIWECIWSGILVWVKSHCRVLATGSTYDKFDTLTVIVYISGFIAKKKSDYVETLKMSLLKNVCEEI